MTAASPAGADNKLERLADLLACINHYLDPIVHPDGIQILVGEREYFASLDDGGGAGLVNCLSQGTYHLPPSDLKATAAWISDTIEHELDGWIFAHAVRNVVAEILKKDGYLVGDYSPAVVGIHDAQDRFLATIQVGGSRVLRVTPAKGAHKQVPLVGDYVRNIIGMIAEEGGSDE